MGEKYNGEPAIIIDGKVYPPMTATTITDNPEYLENKEIAIDVDLKLKKGD